MQFTPLAQVHLRTLECAHTHTHTHTRTYTTTTTTTLSSPSQAKSTSRNVQSYCPNHCGLKRPATSVTVSHQSVDYKGLSLQIRSPNNAVFAISQLRTPGMATAWFSLPHLCTFFISTAPPPPPPPPPLYWLEWQIKIIFGKYGEIFLDRHLPMSLKRKVFNQCVLPAITYGDSNPHSSIGDRLGKQTC